MKWFKHDSDARNSLKLRKLRRKYGADGYAIYWFCLEAIAYDVDKDNLTFELKEDAETIAFELTIQEKRVEEIMLYMVSIGLFESSSNVITCLKLAERIDKSMTNSPKMRKWLDGKSVMTLSDGVSTCAELEVEEELEQEEDKIINKHNVPAKAVTPKFDQEHLEFAKFMFEQIRRLNPNHKQPNFETWAKDIRLMIERDNRTKEQVQQVFVFANNHHFWQSNILSPSKLRKQFDKLVIEMNKPNQPNNNYQANQQTNELGRVVDENGHDWVEQEIAARQEFGF